MSLTDDQHEDELQLKKQKILQVLESELKKDISQEIRTRLEAMWTALKKDEYGYAMRMIYEEYKIYEIVKTNSKPSSKRRSFEELYIEKVGGLFKSLYAIRTDAKLPKEKYKSKDEIKDRVTELVDKFSPLTQSELVTQLVGATAKIELLNQEVEELRATNKFLAFHFEKELSTREVAVSNQKAGKDKKFSNNNQCMRECLDEVLNSGSPDKAISKHVYLRFCRRVKEKYPTPPFVQKIRQSAYEKSQCEELQKIDFEALERKEWAPTTLRAFFEKALKIKIADLS